MTSLNPTIGTKVGRARRSFGQLWQVPTFVVGLLAFLGAAASAPWRHSPETREFEDLIQSIRQGLEPGSDMDGDLLAGHAEHLLVRQAQFPARGSEVEFLVGSAYYRQAQQKPPAYAKEVWPRAVEHLEKALALELSNLERPAAEYRLGYSLYQQGKEVSRAVDLMTQGLERRGEQSLGAYQLLVQANLKLDPPNLDGALAASRRILDLTPESNGEAIGQARLAHAQLLLKKEMRAEALKVLDQVGAKIPRPIRIEARLLQARCSQELGQGARAVAVWQDLLKEAAHVEGGRSRIYYEMGWCYRTMDPPKLPETIKAWTDAINLGGPAGQAAGLHLGDLRLSLGDHEARQALDHWKQAMELVTGADQFQNPHIELKEVRKMFEHALREFEDKRDPQKTHEVAELFSRITKGGLAEDKLAQAKEQRALQMQMQLREKLGNVTEEAMRTQFRQAGEAYEKAAQARPETERGESIWRSAQCYLSAKETKKGQELLHQFVQFSKDEKRLAEGWYLLGDLYRGQSKKENAHDAFVKCAQYRETVFAQRSLYFLAVEEIEKKNYPHARDILNQILVNPPIPVERATQEKSLFKMATLLMTTKAHSEAVLFYTEFIRLFSENPNVIVAREQLGECYRRMAEKELANENDTREQIQRVGAKFEERRRQLDEEMRRHRRKRFELLGEAIATYKGLKEELETRAQVGPLTKIEQILLRRSWFGLGECHIDSEEYVQGLSVFQSLHKKHRQTLEGFYACLRISNLAEVINDAPNAAQFRAMAKESLGLLLDDLKTMQADQDLFRTPGVSSRDEWRRWAETMQTRFSAPLKSDRPMGVFP